MKNETASTILSALISHKKSVIKNPRIKKNKYPERVAIKFKLRIINIK